MIQKLIILLLLIPLFSIHGYTQKHVPQTGVDLRNEVLELLKKRTSWEIIPIPSPDKSIIFNVMILTQDENWKFGRVDSVQSGLIGDILPTYFDYRYPIIEASTELICIGTASVLGNDSTEIKRAKRRGENLGTVMSNYLRNRINKKIYTLNLGKFTKNTKDNPMQRPVVIVGINRNKNYTLKEVETKFKKALIQLKSKLVIDIENYNNTNNFKLKRYN